MEKKKQYTEKKLSYVVFTSKIVYFYRQTDNLLHRFKTSPSPFPRNELLFPQYRHSISSITRANDINDVIIGEKRDDTTRFDDVTIITDASSLLSHPFISTLSNPRGIAGRDKQAGPPSEPSP